MRGMCKVKAAEAEGREASREPQRNRMLQFVDTALVVLISYKAFNIRQWGF